MSLQIKGSGAAADGDSSAVSCTQYTPTVLTHILNKTRPNTYFARNQLFTERVREDKEEFRIESYYEGQQMAPEVCCSDEAPIATPSHMIHSQIVSPAYLKLKTPIDPCKQPQRMVGDDPWMQRPLRERLAAKMVMGTRFLENAIQMREEYMMWKILRDAKYTVYEQDLTTGDFVAKSMIDFKRSEVLGNFKFTWAKDSECILEDIQTMTRTVNCEGDGRITDIILGWQAGDVFRFNKELKDHMRNDAYHNRGQNSFDMNVLPTNNFGNVEPLTVIGGIRYWTSSEFWLDKKGAKHYYVKPNEIIGFSKTGDDFDTGMMVINGPIIHCDEMVPMDRHLESWKEIDPSKRWEKIEANVLPAVRCANTTFRGEINISKAA